MAHIILVTGTHPNEDAVTRDVVLHALAADLAKRGHKLTLHKVPEELSFIHKAQQSTTPVNSLRMEDAEYAVSEHLNEIARTDPTAFIIDLHSKPIIGEDVQQKPSRARVRVSKNAHEHQITLVPPGITPKYFTVEVPAAYVRQTKAIEALRHKLVNPLNARDAHYFTHVANAALTRETNLLNPKNIRRLGHLIDSEVRTRTGEYRAPRAPLYKVATKAKPSAFTIALQRAKKRFLRFRK